MEFPGGHPGAGGRSPVLLFPGGGPGPAGARPKSGLGGAHPGVWGVSPGPDAYLRPARGTVWKGEAARHGQPPGPCRGGRPQGHAGDPGESQGVWLPAGPGRRFRRHRRGGGRGCCGGFGRYERRGPGGQRAARGAEQPLSQQKPLFAAEHPGEGRRFADGILRPADAGLWHVPSAQPADNRPGLRGAAAPGRPEKRHGDVRFLRQGPEPGRVRLARPPGGPRLCRRLGLAGGRRQGRRARGGNPGGVPVPLCRQGENHLAAGAPGVAGRGGGRHPGFGGPRPPGAVPGPGGSAGSLDGYAPGRGPAGGGRRPARGAASGRPDGIGAAGPGPVPPGEAVQPAAFPRRRVFPSGRKGPCPCSGRGQPSRKGAGKSAGGLDGHAPNRGPAGGSHRPARGAASGRPDGIGAAGPGPLPPGKAL